MYEVYFDVDHIVRDIYSEVRRILSTRPRHPDGRHHEFYTAMHGASQRLHGVRVHFNAVHSWFPAGDANANADYHVATCLFHMYSFSELITFAMSAVLSVARADCAASIMDGAERRSITAAKVLDVKHNHRYAVTFPSVVLHWNNHSDVLKSVNEYHTVTKHRQSLPVDGQLRRDIPDSLALYTTQHSRLCMSPYETVILGPDPLLPVTERSPHWADSELNTLEGLMAQYQPFATGTLARLLDDLRRIS